MAEFPSGENTREFFLSYLSKNNVELDILKVFFFANLKEEKISFEYLRKNSIFDYIDPNLLKKLRYHRLVYFKGEDYALEPRGFIAIIHVINSIVSPLCEGAQKGLGIAKKLYDEGFSLGGRSRDYTMHEKLIMSTLENLTEAGFLNFDGSFYSLADEEGRGRVCYEIIKKMIDIQYIQTKRNLEEFISFLKESFLLKNLSLGFLMKHADDTTQKKFEKILSSFDFKERPLITVLRKKATDSIGEKNWLASASYWQLEATLHEEAGETDWVEYCRARGYISLAIFCKRSGNLIEAAKYYEKASEIMSKYPTYTKNAILQLANALQCKAKNAIREGNFQEASTYYVQASDHFRSLGMQKESVFCKYRTFESQAREQASHGEYLTASKLMEEASSVIKPVNEKYYFGGMANSFVYKGDYAQKNDNFEEASKYYMQAAEFFEKSGLQKPYLRTMGRAIQCEAMSLKFSPKAPYVVIAQKFESAATYYGKALDLEAATICQADNLKYLGLDAKNNADWQRAITHFNEGKMLCRELAYTYGDPEAKRRYRDGELWFEAMRMETIAHQKLLDAIPKREELSEVAKLLMHAGDLFNRIGVSKHAEIDSTFVMLTMAIEAFHKEDIAEANSLIQEAKSRLPSDFVFSMFEDEVKVGWQPLRYTLDMIKSFDSYARKIETEKGFSFESRIRELFRKIYPEYMNIESKVFEPQEDEIGVVFNDKTPIDIDALGIKIRENRFQILISEIKNISKPVETNEIVKFLRKIKFIEIRYSKIARLQSLQKPHIEDKIFVSLSGFTSAAKSLADENNIKTLEKDEIIDLLRKHHLYPIP